MPEVVSGVLRPIRFKIEIERISEMEHSFYYEEEYENKDLVERTVNEARPLLESIGYSVRCDGRTIIVEGRNSIESISDMIVSEFLIWSKVGQATLSEIIAIAGMGTANMAKHQDLIFDERLNDEEKKEERPNHQKK